MIYTVKEVKNEIKKGIIGYMQKNEKGDYCLRSSNRIPFYLEGKPGIGKTEIVKQIADELGIGFVSFSITHHTRNSLLGLPVITELECGKYTEYTMSEIIASVAEKVEEGQEEGILLLDEFNCASETIMPTMLAFLQSRNIGKYKLPEGWTIVLCGNPPTYNKSAKRFDAVILDRVRKLQVEYDLKDFLAYAKEQNFYPAILEFLNVNKQFFYRLVQEKDKEEIVTCRGWENLSHTLQIYEKLEQEVDEKLIYQYIKSKEIANSFRYFYWMLKGNITIKELREISNNVNIEKYLELVHTRNFAFQWKLVELLYNLIVSELSDYIEKKNGILPEAKVCRDYSKKMENIMGFLEQLPEAAALTEFFFKNLNESEECVYVLSQVKNEKYLRLCRKVYAEELEEIEKIEGLAV